MITVYVLTGSWWYEDTEVLGVYSSKYLANVNKKHFKSKNFDSMYIQKMIVNKNYINNE